MSTPSDFTQGPDVLFWSPVCQEHTERRAIGRVLVERQQSLRKHVVVHDLGSYANQLPQVLVAGEREQTIRGVVEPVALGEQRLEVKASYTRRLDEETTLCLELRAAPVHLTDLAVLRVAVGAFGRLGGAGEVGHRRWWGPQSRCVVLSKLLLG